MDSFVQITGTFSPTDQGMDKVRLFPTPLATSDTGADGFAVVHEHDGCSFSKIAGFIRTRQTKPTSELRNESEIV